VGKVYLGDAVYAAPDEFCRGIILTTQDGVSATNTIIMEPEVIMAFCRWLLSASLISHSVFERELAGQLAQKG
jgi:hypothetical protein